MTIPELMSTMKLWFSSIASAAVLDQLPQELIIKKSVFSYRISYYVLSFDFMTCENL